MKLARAASVLSAPSRSRTFERIFLAIRNATSSGMLVPRSRALDSTICARVSKSGGSIATDRPQRQPRFQPRLQALDFARIAVAGQDDLLLAVEQRVEGVEELFLGAVLAGEELDVVDQQRVDLLELALERVHRLVLQRLHHRAEELLGAQVHHPHGRVGRAHRVAGGEHQVGLAQAGAAVQQQRVVGAVAGLLRGLQAAARPSWLLRPSTKLSKV